MDWCVFFCVAIVQKHIYTQCVYVVRFQSQKPVILRSVAMVTLVSLQIGINPGLLSAFKGHHYPNPGNHFCMLKSNFITDYREYTPAFTFNFFCPVGPTVGPSLQTLVMQLRYVQY